MEHLNSFLFKFLINSFDDLEPNLTKDTKILFSLNLAFKISLKYKILPILGMTDERIVCMCCRNEIYEYYDDGYKGNRGKCHICGIDFPLE